MNYEIESDRLLMRPLQEDDHDRVTSLTRETSMFADTMHDKSFWSFYIEKCWEEAIAPTTVNLLIFLKDTLDFCGRVNLRGIDTPEPELGIDILREYQNRGIGPEVIRLFSLWAHEKYRIDKVKHSINPGNTHSIHVFEKIGAKRAGQDKSLLEGLLKDKPSKEVDALMGELQGICPFMYEFGIPCG